MTMCAPSLAPARSHQTYVSSASTALEAALRSVLTLSLSVAPWLTTPILAFLQDILENEDVKLDNMFIASMVADIIRVSAAAVTLY